MAVRRKLLPLVTISLLIAAPIERLAFTGSLDASGMAAHAKGGGGGGGGGSGGGGGGGGKGGGNGKGGGQSSTGSSSSKDVGPRSFSISTGATVSVSATSIEVQHPSGMQERLSGGRYEMRDARGRTIINRAAQTADRERLRSLAGE